MAIFLANSRSVTGSRTLSCLVGGSSTKGAFQLAPSIPFLVQKGGISPCQDAIRAKPLRLIILVLLRTTSFATLGHFFFIARCHNKICFLLEGQAART